MQLEDRIVAGIAEERRVVVPIGRARRAWPGRLAAAALGAAAAAAVVLIAVPRDDDQQADARIDIVGTDLAPGVSGSAGITELSSGVRIDFSVKGLPRRDGGDFYQGWLKNCAGTELVPIGTYHELDDATGWAGVSIDDFPVLTVTREQVAPPEGCCAGLVRRNRRQRRAAAVSGLTHPRQARTRSRDETPRAVVHAVARRARRCRVCRSRSRS